VETESSKELKYVTEELAAIQLATSPHRLKLAELRMEFAMLLRLALDLPLRALLIRSNLRA